MRKCKIRAMVAWFAVGVLSFVIPTSSAGQAGAAELARADVARKAEGIDPSILARLKSASWADDKTADILNFFRTQFERCQTSLPETYRGNLASSVNDSLRHLIEEVDHSQLSGYKKAVTERELIELAGRLFLRTGGELPDADAKDRIAGQFANLAESLSKYAHAHQSSYGPEATDKLIAQIEGELTILNTDFFSPVFGKKLNDAEIEFIRTALVDSVDDLVATAQASDRQTDSRFRTDAADAINRLESAFVDTVGRHFQSFAIARDYPAESEGPYAKWIAETRAYREEFTAGLKRYAPLESKASAKAIADRAENDRKENRAQRGQKKANSPSRG